MQHRIIDQKTYQIQKWAHGETTELCLYPPDSGKAFLWRVSSATVTKEHSNFTAYKGVERWIIPFDGPLTLIHSTEEQLLNRITLMPYETHRFSGDWDTQSIGIVRDFNLMLREGATGQLKTIQINPNQSVRLGDIFKEVLEMHIDSTERKMILGFYSLDSGFRLANEKQVIVCMKDDLLLIDYSVSEIELLKLFELSHPSENMSHIVSFVVCY